MVKSQNNSRSTSRRADLTHFGGCQEHNGALARQNRRRSSGPQIIEEKETTQDKEALNTLERDS